MEMEMTIDELRFFSKKSIEDIKELMAQLSPKKEFDSKNLSRMISDTNSHLIACHAEDGRIVGCAALCIFHTPAGTKATIEEVVVHEAYRGKQIGRRIMEYALNVAKHYSPIEIQLTSRPERVAANALYQSLGFERRETNVYRIKE